MLPSRHDQTNRQILPLLTAQPGQESPEGDLRAAAPPTDGSRSTPGGKIQGTPSIF